MFVDGRGKRVPLLRHNSRGLPGKKKKKKSDHVPQAYHSTATGGPEVSVTQPAQEPLCHFQELLCRFGRAVEQVLIMWDRIWHTYSAESMYL